VLSIDVVEAEKQLSLDKAELLDVINPGIEEKPISDRKVK
jgi:hypothetical protein